MSRHYFSKELKKKTKTLLAHFKVQSVSPKNKHYKSNGRQFFRLIEKERKYLKRISFLVSPTVVYMMLHFVSESISMDRHLNLIYFISCRQFIILDKSQQKN